MNGQIGTFLTRLAKNQAGNVLGIVAAALVPLAGMIGGGLDISRGYLAKTRLQQACDAGVLAGRKVMGTNGILTTSVTSEVRKYVKFNYPNNYLGSTLQDVDIVPALGTNDQIDLTITTTVPTVIMGMFGKRTISVAATCSARNDYSNIDIILVLDTTGSMACKPSRDGTSCSNWINNNNRSGKTMTVDGKTVTYVQEETDKNSVNISRMQALRTALTNLQTQMATIESQFNMTEQGKRKRVRWAIIPFSQMVNAGLSKGTAGTTLYDRQPGWFNTTGTYKETSCYQDWYGNVTCSVDKTNTNLAHDSHWMTNTWDGCIEEQGTSNTITSTASTIPVTAYDLKYDTVPSLTANKWTVADPAKVGTAQYACPKAMRELQQMTATDFNAYFNLNSGFAANGGTYLDIGLLWAARLLSRTGNWSADNPSLYNTYPISRYVIFMTDGMMDTGNRGYGAYGQEFTWKRIAADGTIATSNTNHTARWQLTCAAIKNMASTKLYTVSFGAGSDLSQDMIDCSSGGANEFAFKADDASDLNNVFHDIGENIGSLRLSQ
ncbi:TadE/TadG family type IV pilus assembly protein [Sphingobium sp.]|uniref:TadE/TadG family type IV pilus assembly protein n=1 Tax=Sphingobium sp. TaxID=1912891 RepID=UPI003BB5876C